MMSTSDAAESELRAETAQHGTARLRSAAARELQDERFQTFDRNPSGRQSFPSATRQEDAHTALIVSDDSVRREEETAQCDSKIQQPDRTTFTSSLFLRLCSSPDLGANQNPDLISNKKPGISLHSLTATAEADKRRCQIGGQTSGPDLSVKVFTDPTSSEKRRYTDRKTGESLTVTSHELETIKDRTINQTSLSRESGSHEHGGLHSAPSIRDKTQSEKQTDSLEPSDPSRTMLSSSMVMVLAPQWSGKLRRSKKSEGTSNPEAQGTLQDVTNSSSHRGHERFQETADRSSIHRSHEPMRAPFAGTRRNTEGWSTKSGPASLDYEYKRKMTHTVSLDVNSRRLDNRNMNALSPVARASPPTSPLSLDQRRNPQTPNQGGLSSLSSKPITSSLLLSLRRFNSSGRIYTAEERGSEMNPAPALPTRLSPTHRNNNDQDKPNSPLSPPFISSKTSDTAPLLSPPSTNQRGKTVFQTRLFSAPPSDKDKEDTRQPQIITRAQSSLLCSNQAALNRGLAERRQNFRGSHSNLFSESSGSSPSHTSDRSAFLLPRRTTLTSTSWWKQVTQEGSSPPKLDDTISMKDKPNTPFAPPSNNNNKNELAADIKRFNSQIANNRDSNSTTESVCKGSMNPVMKPQGGSQNFKERISGDPPEHDSDKLVKRLNESRFNNREPQKPQSLPAVYYRSKINIATEQTLSHPEDLREPDGRDKSCTPNTTGLRPTLPNPRTLNAPPESNSQHNSNQCAFKANSSPTSPHSKDSHSLSQPLLKTDPSFSSKPVPSQNNYQTQSHSDSSSQTSHFKVGFTPLGFERSYDSVAKSFQPKTASSLLFSKTHTTPVSPSSPTTAKHPAAPDAPRTPLLPPPVIPALTTSSTPNIMSSLLTPPVTPIIPSPDSGPSSPWEGRSLSSSQERDSKKHRSEGKRVRRVTWEDSVDLQNSKPITVKTQEPSQVPTSPLSSPRSSPSVRTPSIFSLLRASRQTTDTSPACSTTTRTSSIQAGKGRKYPSFSSDAAESASKEQDRSKPDPLVLDQKTQEVPTTRQERTLSVESGIVESRSSTALSLPPDFSSGYKLRYSSPPYSTLMSSRSTQGETKPSTPRAQLFQHSLTYVPHLSKKADPSSAMTSPPYKAHATSISPLQSHALPLQSKTSSQESSNFVVSKSDPISNNNNKNKSQDCQSSQTLLVNNRANIGSHSLQATKIQSSSPTCVIETLVYSIKPKGETVASKNSTTKELQRGANTAMSVENRLQSKGTAGEPGSHLEPSSGGGSSTESHSTDDGSRKMKDSVVCKSRLSSVEGSNEQSSKKSRFALKKTTPNSNLSRSESDKANKTNNKMDQVLSKLRQTFSTRRTDDDLSFPWKWRRGSQTPSVGGSSDTSNVSDIPTETKTSAKSEQKKEEVLRDNVKDTEDNSRWTQDRYSLISTPASGGAVAGEKNWSDKSSPENDLGRQSTEPMSGNKIKPHLTIQSPTTNPYNLYDDSRTDYQSSNQLLSSQDLSPGRSSNLSAGYSQFRRSTPSPRSPFSPFSSLSPLSPFPSSDATVADDNVFYSPKLQRRRESPLPCEEKPGEGISLRGSRKSRASTGPPSPGPGQDQICSASSYADLKYGIEPGRSFSVSSVLSSRPSGPGRISTGSRFMSVGDLTESALTCEGTSKDQWSVSPDWTTEFDSLPSKDRLMAYFPSDPDKIKTRSLPRSLTRRLANWSSVPPSEPSTSKPARLWSPNMNTSHFSWDTEGPPTPPPTPPLSPVSRRMSKPPSQSSPTCPISPGQQQVDSPSSRGHLPSRTYVSSLSTFDESSDSGSDTTTDDEYYLETGEEEKETEL
ncbi:mucin-3A [Notolabrus celidotus]|uniref:mucin-3A n=1 Tax=Notolabrus celidotus TaxID=1203425 RepID=UPI00148FB474|nr:mucin-3A [Notolabrus celidotus]